MCHWVTLSHSLPSLQEHRVYGQRTRCRRHLSILAPCTSTSMCVVPFKGTALECQWLLSNEAPGPVTLGSHTWSSVVLWHWTESHLSSTVSASKPPLIWRTRSPRFLLTPQNITSTYSNLIILVFSTEFTPTDSPSDLKLQLSFQQGLKKGAHDPGKADDRPQRQASHPAVEYQDRKET